MEGNEPAWPDLDGNTRMSNFDRTTNKVKGMENNEEWPALAVRNRVTDMITTEEWPQMAVKERMNKKNENEWLQIEASGKEREKRNEKMSWAQIINGQVTNQEVENFGK